MRRSRCPVPSGHDQCGPAWLRVRDAVGLDGLPGRGPNSSNLARGCLSAAVCAPYASTGPDISAVRRVVPYGLWWPWRGHACVRRESVTGSRPRAQGHRLCRRSLVLRRDRPAPGALVRLLLQPAELPRYSSMAARTRTARGGLASAAPQVSGPEAPVAVAGGWSAWSLIRRMRCHLPAAINAARRRLAAARARPRVAGGVRRDRLAPGTLTASASGGS